MLNRANELLQALENNTGLLRNHWAVTTATAMTACYEGPTEVLRYLKDDCIDFLKNDGMVNLQRCPYCLLNSPDTWDHFLPKSEYPEFSVFHQNLVYVCWGCNHRKSDAFRDSELLFLHPSFTVDVNEPMLHCEVRITKNRLSIRFWCALEDPTDGRAAVATSHAKLLDLFKRYQIECASLLSSFISNLARDAPTGITKAALRRAIKHRYQEVSVDLGPNAWEARFWHGALRCSKLLDFINHEVAEYKHNIREGIELASPPSA